MKKILMVDYELFNSKQNGDQQRWWKLYNHLKETNEVHVLINPNQGNQPPPSDWMVFDKKWEISPESRSDIEQACKSYYEKDKFVNPNFLNDLQLTLSLENWFCPLNFVQFYKERLEELKPDLIIFKYCFFRRLLEQTPSHIKTIVDFPISFYQKNVNNAKCNFQGDPGISLEQEIAMIQKASGLSFSHPEEQRLFTETPKPSALFLTEQEEVTDTSEPTIPTITFVGGDQKMNNQYLAGFVEFVWPEVIKANPSTKFLVVGSVQVNPNVINLEKIEHCEDMKSIYDRTTVVINPVIPGAGTKTKVIEAIANKKALVTFRQHLDGIIPNATCVKVSDWEDFGKACIGLLNNQAYREDLKSHCHHYWKLWLSKENCYAKLDKLLETL